MTKSTPLILLTALGGILCFGCYVWFKAAEKNGTDSAQRVTVISSAPNVAQQNPNRKSELPHEATAPQTAAVAQAPTVSRSFAKSRNLAQFVTENAEKAESGDGERAMYIAAAYQECMTFGVDPTGYVEQRRKMFEQRPKDLQTDRERFDAATQREVERCGELSQQHDKQQQIDRWIATGSKAGNLSAQIALVETSSEAPTAQRLRDLVTDVLTSKDGLAISQLGNLLSSGLNDRTEFQTYGGNANANYAWQLAACHFGMDCSSTGQSVQQICSTAGLCAFASLEEAYSKLLSPLEFQHVLKQRDELIAIIDKGDTNSLYH